MLQQPITASNKFIVIILSFQKQKKYLMKIDSIILEVGDKKPTPSFNKK